LFQEPMVKQHAASGLGWRSQPVWWRATDGVPFRSGWLIERTLDGAVFLYRGQDGLPTAGAPIWTALNETATADDVEPGTITGIERIHADLFLVRITNSPAYVV
jgi:hypothetical protein